MHAINKLTFLTFLTTASASVLAYSDKYNLHPTQFLPPVMDWHGNSEALIKSANKTPIEQSDFSKTPDYEQTIAWLEKISQQSPLIQMSYFGVSAQGRKLPLIHASSNFKAKNRPTLLAQAGIHSGEIDGKDAGMMLLRDIALGDKAALIDDVDLLFVPIFNADGHENSSIYNRVNQRGPTNMGWRTTAQNINLNRDYAKAQSVEMKAMLKLINDYQPSLYLDLHVTDGSDYQYDITYGTAEKFSYSPAIATWFANNYRPTIDKALTDNGHVPGPLVFAVDGNDFNKGIAEWASTPRFSDGYGAARHLPTVLVENHSLKPYKQRVLGTYILIESSLKALKEHGDALALATSQDKAARPTSLPLGWDYNQPTTMAFKGIAFEQFDDPISGTKIIKWLGTPKLYPNLPVIPQNVPMHVTKVPAAYWLMPEQHEAISVLQAHGVTIEVLDQPQRLRLEQQQAFDEKFGTTPYEGAQRVSAQFTAKMIDITLPKGAVKVSTDQPLGKLAFNLLEPMSADSFFQWGFFNTIFQRTEYIEGYAVVPLAKEMLAQNPKLQQAFEEKIKQDKEFASSPRARLQWFYQRSPFYDRNHNRYPVLRQW